MTFVHNLNVNYFNYFNYFNRFFIQVNSLWSCENPETLKGDLKTILGFNGWVMSDWGATHSTSIAAGLDQVRT